MKLVPRLAIVVGLCLTAAVPSLSAPPVVQAQGPYITRSPASGVPGDNLTITGYNFTAGETVGIYYYLDDTTRTLIDVVTVETDTSFRVTFQVPNSYRGTHKVRAEETSVIYADTEFSVRSGLTVSPEEGHVGDSVTVTGRGYGKNETGIRLYFRGERVAADRDIEADAYGRWTVSFEIPLSIRGSHTIDTQPSAYKRAAFTVIPGIRADKSSGSVGASITMTGSGFTANERNIRILFDGKAVVEDIWADEKGYWQEPFEVPEMPGGNYSVTAEGDWTKEEELGEISFKIEPGIVLYPDEGHVGMNLTVTGRGFGANKDVVVLYEGTEVETPTITTDDKASFEVTFAVPESRYGEREVTAEDAEGKKATAVFTMESDPPSTPELISPPDGGRAGFVDRVRPRFEWSEVEDPSGVYYNLQIATSANVTATGEFVDPIVTKEGLVGANYTLEKADALPYGTYYWIVQAVDRAENTGNWTAVYSFRAGLLPLWAFIVIIVLVVSGGGGAAYFYLRRRRLYD